MLDELAFDSGQSVVREAEAKDELERVLRALHELPEIHRTRVLMRADEALSYEEIALALGLPVATVKVKLHRARLRLTKVRNEGAPVR